MTPEEVRHEIAVAVAAERRRLALKVWFYVAAAVAGWALAMVYVWLS